MTLERPPLLPELQHWMQAVLQHPFGVTAGAQAADSAFRPEVAEVITASSRQSSVERLGVYAQAYWARLLECLRAEFPAVLAAAGDEAFAGLAAGYLQTYPSQSKSLHQLGKDFSTYLAAARPPRANHAPDAADFLIDLAALERCYSEVFDAEGPEQSRPLDSQQLAERSPDDLSHHRLEFFPTVRLITLRFPCHEFASAIRHGGSAETPAGSKTHLVVYRTNYVVQRQPLANWQHILLSSLMSGTDNETGLHQAVVAEDWPQEAASAIRATFRNWTAAPLIRAVI